MEASDILFDLRRQWPDEPRCLVFSDFYHDNLALPKSGSEYAVLFDWELAAYGLPQFDMLNAGFADNDRLAYYLTRMREMGMELDRDRLEAGLGYARLCGSFFMLWLLHLKLKADRDGRLPAWMRAGAAGLFAGGLIEQARQARAA